MRWRAWLAEADSGWLAFAAMTYVVALNLCFSAWLLVTLDLHAGWALLVLSCTLALGVAAAVGVTHLAERAAAHLADAHRRADPRLTELSTRTRRAFRKVEEVSDCTGWKIASVVALPAEHGPGFVLQGVAGGRYQASAEASCLLRREHDAPFPECTCGFHAWHTLPLARRYAQSVLLGDWVFLQVELAGDIFVYEHGVRAASQDVLGVGVPPCSCGEPAAGLHLRGVPGYCAPVCAGCVTGELVSFASLASALGVEVAPLR